MSPDPWLHFFCRRELMIAYDMSKTEDPLVESGIVRKIRYKNCWYQNTAFRIYLQGNAVIWSQAAGERRMKQHVPVRHRDLIPMHMSF